jgi:hypothetical protein
MEVHNKILPLDCLLNQANPPLHPAFLTHFNIIHLSMSSSPKCQFHLGSRLKMFISLMRVTCLAHSCFLIQSYETHYVRGPFEKFVDSPYYSESELCGDAVTISFLKCLPRQVKHFLQRSTHFSKTCCRPLIASNFFASELPSHGWKSPEIAWAG